MGLDFIWADMGLVATADRHLRETALAKPLLNAGALAISPVTPRQGLLWVNNPAVSGNLGRRRRRHEPDQSDGEHQQRQSAGVLAGGPSWLDIAGADQSADGWAWNQLGFTDGLADGESDRGPDQSKQRQCVLPAEVPMTHSVAGSLPAHGAL